MSTIARRASFRRIAVVAATGGLLAAAFAAAPHADAKPGKGGDRNVPKSEHTYGGEATALSADVADLHISLVHAGPIPADGGVDEDSLLSGSVEVAEANVLHATVVGDGDTTSADASVADLTAAVDTVGVSASVLVSEASVSCDAGVAQASGVSWITDLTVTLAGQSIPVNVGSEPNQEVDLGVGIRLVLNEQTATSSGATAAITVNALRLEVNTVADGLVVLVVSSATASMTCDPGLPPGAPDDWFTGGGFINGTPTGDRGSFGVAGGERRGGLWGHLNYVDHAGLHVRGTSITDYRVVDAVTRTIEGAAKIGRQRVTFVVTVADRGEPGTADTFQIVLSNGYEASGTLGGGNLQLHPTR